MKASDPVLHQQLGYLADSGRKSIGGATAMLVLTSFYDEEEKANANMMACAVADDINAGEEQVDLMIRTLVLSLGNLLSQSTHLEVVLRDKRDGTELDDIMKKTHGATALGVDL